MAGDFVRPAALVCGLIMLAWPGGRPGRSRGGWCGIRLSIQAALPLPADETSVPAALLAQMLAREQVVALVPYSI